MNSKHVNGTVGELKAAAHLASEGYEIFWPAAPQSCVDFLALKNGLILKVQVKHAYWMTRPSGASYLQVTTRKGAGGSKTYSKEDCDIMIVVFEDSLWAFPIDIVHKYKTISLEKGQNLRKSKEGALDASGFKIK